ncbi:MAG: 30S ribosomal protein S2 [Candidatus Komeilibacteria bacterium]|nr:30S ribosomal protein S2 [Candidatus Komeilibacteria bacterium]
MPNIPELVEMVKSGVHFGHQSSKRYPKAEDYVHSTRNKIDIINLEKTVQGLEKALAFIKQTVAAGGAVIFISSKRQAKAIIEKYAIACGMPYITSRWLGGTFTNFYSINQLVKTLKDLEAKFASGEMNKYTKKEQLEFQREMERLNELVGGLKPLSKLPEAVFIVDIKKEKTAVAEALKKKIPIVALVDTNVNPSVIQYPIPANDDATKSIEMMTRLVAEAVEEGKAEVGKR